MKTKSLSILTACLVVAGGTSAQSAQSLYDDFNGASINPALWSTFVTSFGNSSISESSGNVRFVNGSWLTTVAQFPNASVSSRFSISGWNYDRFKVLVRSDGTSVDSHWQDRIGGIGIQFTSGSDPDYGTSQTGLASIWWTALG